MRYAQVKDGYVVNIIEAETGFEMAGFHLVGDDAGAANIGGTWDGTAFGPVPDLRTLEEVRAAKLAALAERRWMVETGGIIVNGMPISTDDRVRRIAEDTGRDPVILLLTVIMKIDENEIVQWMESGAPGQP